LSTIDETLQISFAEVVEVIEFNLIKYSIQFIFYVKMCRFYFQLSADWF
jgi:hypothetical protein